MKTAKEKVDEKVRREEKKLKRDKRVGRDVKNIEDEEQEGRMKTMNEKENEWIFGKQNGRREKIQELKTHQMNLHTNQQKYSK